MSELTDYFLGSKKSEIEFETLTISHPNMSKTYRLVRNSVGGLQAKDQNGVLRTFDYAPLRINRGGRSDDLNFAIKVDYGDLGEVTGKELDNIRAADGFLTKPAVTVMTYRATNLDIPLDGPYVLEASALGGDGRICSFTAEAPQLNILATGEIYDPDRFEMLQGFL